MKMMYSPLLLVLFVFAVQNIPMVEGEKGAQNAAEQEKKDNEKFIADTEEKIKYLKEALSGRVVKDFKNALGKKQSFGAAEIRSSMESYVRGNLNSLSEVEDDGRDRRFKSAKGWENCKDMINGLTEATTIRYSDVEHLLKGIPDESLETLKGSLENTSKTYLNGRYKAHFRGLQVCP
ncbi:uncharacterized protein LOC129000297 [Macrosteles quadrilineatus]|uniref:uncharacterized protein LOC129000297 n=1 Tax=Macrosteles quadrilineatus TaxID=74068 RepID=UPI0023E2D7AC|nr:uncharacterized protein LOC129000297 [Macrosteles quadrilineatus]